MARQAPTDYPGVARLALDRLKPKTAARLAKVVAKTPSRSAVRLTFAVSWNGYHELSVYCAPQCDDGQYTSHSNPFGPLLAFDAPPGQEDDPTAFAGEKPVVGQMVLMELADWWKQAGGAAYPRPVVGTTEGEPLQVFDFKCRQWGPDDIAERVAGHTAAFAALVRQRLAEFRPLVAERLTKATAKFGAGEWTLAVMVFFDDEFEVMFDVTDGTKSGNGRLFPPHSRLAKLLKNDAFPGDRDRYAELGVDTQHAHHRELELFAADVWEAAAGPKRTRHGTLEYHDGGAEYDLVARRWRTDFLGRPLPV